MNGVLTMRSPQLIIAVAAAVAVSGAATYALAQTAPADSKAAQSGNTSNASNPGPLQRDGQTTPPAGMSASSAMGSRTGTMQRAQDGTTGTTMGTPSGAATSSERMTRDGAPGTNSGTSSGGMTNGMTNGSNSGMAPGSAADGSPRANDMRTPADTSAPRRERAARADRN
jgi:hypothetical protein